jgi:hypothetical protein
MIPASQPFFPIQPLRLKKNPPPPSSSTTRTMTSNVVVSIFSPVCLASAALRHRVHRTLVTHDGDSATSQSGIRL